MKKQRRDAGPCWGKKAEAVQAVLGLGGETALPRMGH